MHSFKCICSVQINDKDGIAVIYQGPKLNLMKTVS